MRKPSITVLGAGSWGTTIAIVLARKKVTVKLHSFFPEHNRAMIKEKQNRQFLKNIKFPAGLSIEPDLKKALASQIIVMAIPVKFLPEVLIKLKNQADFKDKIIVSLSKGIDSKTLKRPSELIKQALGKVKVAVLSGPNIALEIAQELPSASIIACADKRCACKLQEIFNSANFRVYLCDDLVGVELGGALKNIIAIACGISDGLGFGTNAKAALVTRGLVEITRLGKALGAQAPTFWGISGLGDLVTTCFSAYSRNRSLGEKIAQGKNYKQLLAEMEMVAEGAETVKSAFKLSKKIKVDMPIVRAVYAVLYQRKTAVNAVKLLMTRPLKPENYS